MIRAIDFAVSLELSSFGIGFIMDDVKEVYSGDNGVMFTFQFLWLKTVTIINFGQED